MLSSERSRIPVLVGLAVVVAGLGTSCAGDVGSSEALGSESVSVSGGAPDTTAPSTTTTTAPTTTEDVPVAAFPEPDEGEVFDAYIADRLQTFREVVRAASEDPTLTPEIDFPEIADYAAGLMLKINHELIVGFAQDGTAVREPEESSVGRTVDERTRVSPVIENNGDTVTVFECFVDDADLVDQETGAIRISGVLTGLAVITMQRFDDGWKVIDGEVTQKLKGVDGCFLASEAEFPY